MKRLFERILSFVIIIVVCFNTIDLTVFAQEVTSADTENSAIEDKDENAENLEVFDVQENAQSEDTDVLFSIETNQEKIKPDSEEDAKIQVSQTNDMVSISENQFTENICEEEYYKVIFELNSR